MLYVCELIQRVDGKINLRVVFGHKMYVLFIYTNAVILNKILIQKCLIKFVNWFVKIMKIYWHTEEDTKFFKEDSLTSSKNHFRLIHRLPILQLYSRNNKKERNSELKEQKRSHSWINQIKNKNKTKIFFLPRNVRWINHMNLLPHIKI